MASFLLHCSICPKAPDFSDLSHLLTHVGSKGHLSHYFKAQVRSRQDSSIREQLQAYDQWYRSNQVEKLLSQRMVLKENKNAQNRSRAISKRQPVRTYSREPINPESSAFPSHFRKDEAFLDPQLSQDLTLSRLPSPIRPESVPAVSPLANRAHVVPRMQNWSTTNQLKMVIPRPKTPEAQRGLSSTSLELSEIPGGIADDEIQVVTPLGHMYPEPPALPKLYAFLSASKSYISINKNNIDEDSVDEIDHEQNELEQLDDKANECTRLKGVCWPGMDIFDSASPDTRRRRNQKKDGSILAQMKANSAVVEPTELIFYSGGQLKKRRYISGQVESSPIKEETPKPKRQRVKFKRAPLRSVSSNVLRNGRKLEVDRSISHVMRPQNKSADVLTETLSAREASPVQQKGRNRQETPTLDDDEVEWRLMLGELQNGKRSGFDIYDESSPKSRPTKQSRPTGRTHDEMYPFLHDRRSVDEIVPTPHGLPELTLHYGLEAPPMATTTQYMLRHVYDENLETFGLCAADQFSSRFLDDKENVQPIVNQPGRIDEAAARLGAMRNTQRYFVMDGNSHPQYYSSMPQHWGFMSAQPPQSYAYAPNPLSFSFGHPDPSSQFQSQFPVQYPPLPASITGTTGISNKSRPSAMTQDDSGDETIDEGDVPRSMTIHEERHE